MCSRIDMVSLGDTSVVPEACGAYWGGSKIGVGVQ